MAAQLQSGDLLKGPSHSLGGIQIEAEGGERIFSKEDDEKMISLAKEGAYDKLGKLYANIVDKHSSTEPEFVGKYTFVTPAQPDSGYISTVRDLEASLMKMSKGGKLYAETGAKTGEDIYNMPFDDFKKWVADEREVLNLESTKPFEEKFLKEFRPIGELNEKRQLLEDNVKRYKALGKDNLADKYSAALGNINKKIQYQEYTTSYNKLKSIESNLKKRAEFASGKELDDIVSKLKIIEDNKGSVFDILDKSSIGKLTSSLSPFKQIVDDKDRLDKIISQIEPTRAGGQKENQLAEKPSIGGASAAKTPAGSTETQTPTEPAVSPEDIAKKDFLKSLDDFRKSGAYNVPESTTTATDQYAPAERDKSKVSDFITKNAIDLTLGAIALKGATKPIDQYEIPQEFIDQIGVLKQAAQIPLTAEEKTAAERQFRQAPVEALSQLSKMGISQQQALSIAPALTRGVSQGELDLANFEKSAQRQANRDYFDAVSRYVDLDYSLYNQQLNQQIASKQSASALLNTSIENIKDRQFVERQYGEGSPYFDLQKAIVEEKNATTDAMRANSQYWKDRYAKEQVDTSLKQIGTKLDSGEISLDQAKEELNQYIK